MSIIWLSSFMGLLYFSVSPQFMCINLNKDAAIPQVVVYAT